MTVKTFKVDNLWHYRVGDHHEMGFATKDEAQLMGEKFVVDQRRAEARSRREAKKSEKEE